MTPAERVARSMVLPGCSIADRLELAIPPRFFLTAAAAIGYCQDASRDSRLFAEATMPSLSRGVSLALGDDLPPKRRRIAGKMLDAITEWVVIEHCANMRRVDVVIALVLLVNEMVETGVLVLTDGPLLDALDQFTSAVNEHPDLLEDNGPAVEIQIEMMRRLRLLGLYMIA